MTNPQLAENLLAVIRGLPAADRHWLLLQLEQDNGDTSANTLAQMAMAGGAFADLAAAGLGDHPVEMNSTSQPSIPTSPLPI